MLLSLIIPTYNERQNVVSLIDRVTFVLEKAIGNFEIIVVDDDSPDGTWQAAQELAGENNHLRVIRRRGERGLATAVVEGWRAAKGEILGVMDGDLQHPPEILADLVKSILGKDTDIVVASRNVSGGGVSEWSLIRRAISWGASCTATLALPGLLNTVRDPMSGFFMFKRSVIESDGLKPRGYKILLEVLAKGNYKAVSEVPYIFEERKQGGSKLGPKQYLEFIVHIIRLSREMGHVSSFLRFCLVGLSGVFVNEGALKFFTETGGFYYLYSSVLAVELAIVSNFLLNEFWTFRDRSSQLPGLSNRLRRFLKFNFICTLGGVLNVSILWVLTDLAGLNYLVSNLFGIGLSALWNYGLNSNITWEVQMGHKALKEGSQEEISPSNACNGLYHSKERVEP